MTWAYDASTQLWHQRAHDDFLCRERYNCHVFAFGKHLFGDFANGNIYELDGTIGTINGAAIPKERTSPSWGDEEKRIPVRAFQLDMEEGQHDNDHGGQHDNDLGAGDDALMESLRRRLLGARRRR